MSSRMDCAGWWFGWYNFVVPIDTAIDDVMLVSFILCVARECCWRKGQSKNWPGKVVNACAGLSTPLHRMKKWRVGSGYIADGSNTTVNKNISIFWKHESARMVSILSQKLCHTINSRSFGVWEWLEAWYGILPAVYFVWAAWSGPRAT